MSELAEKIKRKMGLPRSPKDSRRLPHNSKFAVQYDAKKEQWHGFLCAKVGGKTETFYANNRGVFGLLRRLDQTYRAVDKAAKSG